MSHFTTSTSLFFSISDLRPALQTDLHTKPSNYSINHSIWPQLRPPHLNITTDHRQTRSPNPTIRTDLHRQTRQPDQIRSPHQTTDHNPWLFSFQAAQHNQPSEMVQVRCIHYGLGQGGYIELWMNLAKHTFHTRSASSFRNFFGLNLTVLRLASGSPGLVRAFPSLFHKMGSFAGVRSAIRVRLLGIGWVFSDSASIQGNGSAASFCTFFRWTSPPPSLSSSSSSLRSPA